MTTAMKRKRPVLLIIYLRCMAGVAIDPLAAHNNAEQREP